MYRCLDCGQTFDEPIRVKSKVNLDGENGWWDEIETYCPWCGSEDFEEVDEYGEDEDCP